METILWYIAVGGMIAPIAISSVIAVALYCRERRSIRSSRMSAIRHAYHLHYQRKNAANPDKR